MKKSKLLISAIVIVGILTGTLAFKSSRYMTHYLYTGPLVGGARTVEVDGIAISGGGNAIVRAWIAPLASACPQVFTTEIFDD